MIFYLGDKIKPKVSESEIKQRNKLGKWSYGYNEAIDAVVISKDGTIGDIYHVQGLNIALPAKPPKEQILNYGKDTRYQKWTRTELPDALTDEAIDYELNGEKDEIKIQEIINRIYGENFDYIEEEFRRRDEGVWCMINGNEVYIPGTYYYGIQWVREEVKYPSFRAIQNDLMIFWQACKADQRCFGMQYVKNRRMGASLLAIFEHLESASIYENKINGIISKTGEDARLLFERLVNGFKRLPMFFKPVTDGTTSPKKKLIFDEPTRRRKKGEKMSAGSGLSSSIAWYNTVKNAMDGSAIFRSLCDECYAPGTKILMEDMTFKNIEDIKIGDTVIVEGGKKVKVHKTTSGKTEMYLVKQKYEKDYVVSKNHRLYLEQRCNVKGIDDDGVKIMTPDQYLSLGKYKTRTTYGVRSKGLELPSKKTTIDPYLFGVWIGDGDSDASRFIVNTEKDPEIGEYIEEYCEKNNYGISIIDSNNSDVCSRYSINRPDNEQHLNGKWNQNKFRLKLKQLDVFNNKHIPSEYLNNSKEVRLNLLAGIIDTDGCLQIKNNSYIYEVASSRENLAYQINFICMSLGFKTTLKKRKSNFNTVYWSIYISGEKLSEIPCKVLRKIVPESYSRSYACHINNIDIKPIGIGKYHGIQVEADNDDDRRLILEDFTLSMNSGKYPKEVPFDAYWRIVKTSHKKGIVITGKSMVISTVNSFKDGGLEYFKVWKQSNLEVRDGNGQTKSGLYRIFIAAKYCLEGMFDEYGFTILEDPKEPTKTDEGAITKIGSITWLQNEADALKGDPDAYNEHKRQFPDTIKDAFRDSSDDCEFNLMNIQEQLEHNEHELNDFYGEGEEDWKGNDDVERGNFVWQNGVQDTVVEWKPNPEGRFFIKKGCHPPEQFKNQSEERYSNGRTGKSPLGKHIGVFGVDPYNRSKNADGRGSKGAIILTTKEHTCDELPNNAMILEYIDRPKKVTLFFEDVIMVSVYYSIPFLSELSNERFLA